MKKSVFVKEAAITVKEMREPCRNVKLLVKLDNDDIFERAVSVTAEIYDAQQQLVTACSKKAFLEGMGSTEAELAVFLVRPVLYRDQGIPYSYKAQIRVQEYEKELDCYEQRFRVQA